jgi:DNA-binding NtrC family response regulator
MESLRILVIQREESPAGSVPSALRAAGHEVRTAAGAEAAALLAQGKGAYDIVTLDLGLPGLDLAALAQLALPQAAPLDPLEIAERRHITSALRHTRGNKRQAAHLLGIARSTLLAKVRKYGLEGVRA